MLVIVTYDVNVTEAAGRRRLRKISKKCIGYGIRVQKSVFECRVDPAQWSTLKSELLDLYEPSEDSLRFYYMGSNWDAKVEHYGDNNPIDIDDEIIL